ncbi:MAG: hypothetical protein V4681_02760 [Patescibacteria group bacterium]
MSTSKITPPTVTSKLKRGSVVQIEVILGEACTKKKTAFNWTVEMRAAFLAAYRAGLAIAQEIKDRFGITAKLIGDWAKNAGVIAKRDQYFVPA